MGKVRDDDAAEKRKLSYINQVDKRLRSRMNVPFLFDVLGEKPDQLYVENLLKEANEAGLCGLKGHRSIGGMRASIYNSLEYESVVALCEFLKDFMTHPNLL